VVSRAAIRLRGQVATRRDRSSRRAIHQLSSRVVIRRNSPEASLRHSQPAFHPSNRVIHRKAAIHRNRLQVDTHRSSQGALGPKELASLPVRVRRPRRAR
jgi:hypothetical protein